MARVIDIVWVVLDAAGDLITVRMSDYAAEEQAEDMNERLGRGYHVKEAQLIWNE